MNVFALQFRLSAVTYTCLHAAFQTKPERMSFTTLKSPSIWKRLAILGHWQISGVR